MTRISWKNYSFPSNWLIVYNFRSSKYPLAWRVFLSSLHATRCLVAIVITADREPGRKRQARCQLAQEVTTRGRHSTILIFIIPDVKVTSVAIAVLRVALTTRQIPYRLRATQHLQHESRKLVLSRLKTKLNINLLERCPCALLNLRFRCFEQCCVALDETGPYLHQGGDKICLLVICWPKEKYTTIINRIFLWICPHKL